MGKCPQTLHVLKLTSFEIRNQSVAMTRVKSNPLLICAAKRKEKETGLVPPTSSWPTAGQQCYSFSLCPGGLKTPAGQPPACMWHTTLLDLQDPGLVHLRCRLWPVLSCAPIRSTFHSWVELDWVTHSSGSGGPFTGGTGPLPCNQLCTITLFYSCQQLSASYIILVVLGRLLWTLSSYKLIHLN